MVHAQGPRLYITGACARAASIHYTIAQIEFSPGWVLAQGPRLYITHYTDTSE
jgi:hypothetical protein